MTPRRLALAAVLVIGCGKTLAPRAPAEAPDSVLAMARARPVASDMQARFNVRVQSAPLGLAGSTGGGVVIARPGRGRLDVFGPLGNLLVSVVSDGTALAARLVREERHLLAEDAELVIRETTGGAAGLDDLLAVLQGDLPFDDATPRALERLDDGSARVWLTGPNGTDLEARVDPARGVPISLVARDARGAVLLAASYGEWLEVDDQLLPQQVTLEVPRLELVIELRYRGWKALGEAPPVFSVDAPPGVASEALEAVVTRWVEGAAKR